MRDDGPNIPSHGRERVHEIMLTNREHLRVAGVLHVGSFDDRQIVLDTDLGTLTIDGEDLQIRQLDLEAGAFIVDGVIAALTYSSAAAHQDSRRKGKGFLERLLR